MKYFNQDSTPQEETTPEVNMSPLIDMVFLLLIFFMVTTVFVQDTAVDIQRPQATTARIAPDRAITVILNAQGEILWKGRRITIHQIRETLAEAEGTTPRPVLIIADQKAPAGLLVSLIDQCRLSGAPDVAVAATPVPKP